VAGNSQSVAIQYILHTNYVGLYGKSEAIKRRIRTIVRYGSCVACNANELRSPGGPPVSVGGGSEEVLFRDKA
jgi:hypothetical protein